MTLSGSETIRDEAARWVDATLGGAARDEDAFRRWIEQSPGHQQSYDQLLAVAHDRALEQALAAFDHPGRVVPLVAPAAGRRGSPVIWGAGAAVAAGWAAVMLWMFAGPIETWMTPKTVYETHAGEQLTVAFDDGSRAFLNGDTRLEARISAHRRHVHLDSGEAFFDVRHDAQRPFTVALGDGKVEDLGTQFDVSYVDRAVEVSVYGGTVRLTGRKAFGDLTAGQGARLSDGAIRWLPVFDPAGGDWRQGWIEPRDWPLARVAEALQRHSGVRIVIRGAALQDKRITGRLRLDNPEQQLTTLALIHGFHVRRGGAGLIVE